MGPQDSSAGLHEQNVLVMGLRTSEGRVHWLEPLRSAPGLPYYVRLGKDPNCEIVTKGAGVRDVHCVLVVSKDGVEVENYGTAKTKVNKVRLTSGRTALHSGSQLLLGRHTRFVACGSDPKQPAEIVTTNIPDMVRESIDVYRTRHMAAGPMRVERRKFYRWVDKIAAGATLCALIGVGWYWTRPATSKPASVVPRVSAEESPSQPSEQSGVEGQAVPLPAASTSATVGETRQYEETSKSTTMPRRRSVRSDNTTWRPRVEVTEVGVTNEVPMADRQVLPLLDRTFRGSSHSAAVKRDAEMQRGFRGGSYSFSGNAYTRGEVRQ